MGIWDLDITKNFIRIQKRWFEQMRKEGIQFCLHLLRTNGMTKRLFEFFTRRKTETKFIRVVKIDLAKMRLREEDTVGEQRTI